MFCSIPIILQNKHSSPALMKPATTSPEMEYIYTHHSPTVLTQQNVTNPVNEMLQLIMGKEDFEGKKKSLSKFYYIYYMPSSKLGKEKQNQRLNFIEFICPKWLFSTGLSDAILMNVSLGNPAT